MNNIESERGPISKKLMRDCDNYAIDILGHKKYAPWLYIYSAISGQFKEGWIPLNFYEAQVIPNIKGYYGDCSYLKPLNSFFFKTDKSPDLGSFVNGLFLDRFYRAHSFKELKSILFNNCTRVVFKVDNSLQGQGIYIFNKSNFSAKVLERLGNGVFQSYVNQHSLFNEYTLDSVATIRITTAVDDAGNASVRGAYLRLGVAQDTYVRSETAIRIPIGISTGVLADTGYMPSWITVNSHSDSRKNFTNVKIPSFENCINVVKSLQMKVPFVRCIGWDVTVDNEGEVVVLEWNGVHNGISFSEATQGPSFADLGWEKFR